MKRHKRKNFENIKISKSSFRRKTSMSNVNCQLLNVGKNGFSMLEAVIATFVLSVGIVAVMSLLVSSLRHSMDSRDTTIATELVQEGLELVRNVRDNDIASGVTSFTNFSNSNTCQIDKTYVYTTSSSINCAAGNTFVLRYDASSFYEHAAGSNTKFKRKITIADFGTTGKTITSIVTWGGATPPNTPITSNCSVSNKCTFAKSILVAR